MVGCDDCSPVFASDDSTLFFLCDQGSVGIQQVWGAPLLGSAAAYKISNLPVGATELGSVPWGDGDEHLVNMLVFSAKVVASDEHEDAVREHGALEATAKADAADASRRAQGIVAVDSLPVRRWASWETRRRCSHVFLLAVARPFAPSTSGSATSAETMAHRWRSGRYLDLMHGVEADCPEQPFHCLADAVSFAPGAGTACLAYRPPEWHRAYAWSTGTAIFQCRGLPVLEVVTSARDAAEMQRQAAAAPTVFRLAEPDAAHAMALPTEVIEDAGADDDDASSSGCGSPGPVSTFRRPLPLTIARTSTDSTASLHPGSPHPRLRTVASFVEPRRCTEGLPGPDGSPATTLPVSRMPVLPHECLTGSAASAAWAPAFSPDGGTLVWLQMRRPGYESDRAAVHAAVAGPSGAIRVSPAPRGATIPARTVPQPPVSTGASAPVPAELPRLSACAASWELTAEMDCSFGSLEWLDEMTLLAAAGAVRGTSRAAVLRVEAEFAGADAGGATPGVRKAVERVHATCALLRHRRGGSLSSLASAGTVRGASGRLSFSEAGTRYRLLALHSAMHLPAEVAAVTLDESAVEAAAAAAWSTALPLAPGALAGKGIAAEAVAAAAASAGDAPALSPADPAMLHGLPLVASASATEEKLLTDLARPRLAAFSQALPPALYQTFPQPPAPSRPALPGDVEDDAGRAEALASAAPTASSSRAVQQWVLLPPGVDATSAAPASVPVMVLVHGGPQGSYGDDFHRRWNPQVFAAQGFACVMTNFTGSTGFGQAFCDAIRGDWGGQPAADVLGGLKAAAAAWPCLDLRRAVCCGASYGGYMVNWMQSFAPAGTFRCLIGHAGLFDLRAFYYSTDELWFPEHDFGGTYGENSNGYERFNPARFAPLWRTPMLLTTGGRDFRVPQEQALAAFTALKRNGVAARLLVLPEASHFVTDPTQFVLWTREMVAWAADWVSTGAPTLG